MQNTRSDGFPAGNGITHRLQSRGYGWCRFPKRVVAAGRGDRITGTVQHAIGDKYQILGLGLQGFLRNHAQHIVGAAIQGHHLSTGSRPVSGGLNTDDIGGIQRIIAASIQRDQKHIRRSTLRHCLSKSRANAGRINAATGKADVKISVGRKAVQAINCRLYRIGRSAHVSRTVATGRCSKEDIRIQRQIGGQRIETGVCSDLKCALTLIGNGITAATTGRQCQGHCRRQYFLVDMHGFSQTICYLFYF